MEAEIRRQREATNQLLQGLDYESQTKYMSMKEANFELQQKAEQLQSQVISQFNLRDDLKRLYFTQHNFAILCLYNSEFRHGPFNILLPVVLLRPHLLGTNNHFIRLMALPVKKEICKLNWNQTL